MRLAEVNLCLVISSLHAHKTHPPIPMLPGFTTVTSVDHDSQEFSNSSVASGLLSAMRHS